MNPTYIKRVTTLDHFEYSGEIEIEKIRDWHRVFVDVLSDNSTRYSYNVIDKIYQVKKITEHPWSYAVLWDLGSICFIFSNEGDAILVAMSICGVTGMPNSV